MRHRIEPGAFASRENDTLHKYLRSCPSAVTMVQSPFPQSPSMPVPQIAPPHGSRTLSGQPLVRGARCERVPSRCSRCRSRRLPKSGVSTTVTPEPCNGARSNGQPRNGPPDFRQVMERPILPPLFLRRGGPEWCARARSCRASKACWETRSARTARELLVREDSVRRRLREGRGQSSTNDRLVRTGVVLDFQPRGLRLAAVGAHTYSDFHKGQ